MKLKKQMKALGCHIYAGGFSLGVRDAGFRLLGHLEEWPFGVATSKKNLGVEVWQGVESWEEAVKRYRGRVDFLYGNPPCAGWSTAGHRPGSSDGSSSVRWPDDPRTQCTLRHFELVDRLDHPTVFAWESVAAAMRNGRPFVDARAEEMVERGYRVYVVLFDGYRTGLPQRRRRMFFIASKVRLRFEPPGIEAPSVREVLADPRVAGGPGSEIRKNELAVLKEMPKGITSSLSKHFNKKWEKLGREPPRNPRTGNVMGRPPFVCQRVGYDKPSPTITGGAAYFHPTKLRPLTVSEQAALCGYPPDWDWSTAGGLGKQYAEIGKAVTRPAGRWLSTVVMAGLEAGEPARPGYVIKDFLHGGVR